MLFPLLDPRITLSKLSASESAVVALGLMRSCSCFFCLNALTCDYISVPIVPPQTVSLAILCSEEVLTIFDVTHVKDSHRPRDALFQSYIGHHL